MDDGDVAVEHVADAAAPAMTNTWLHIGVCELNPVLGECQRLSPHHDAPLSPERQDGAVSLQGQWDFVNTRELARDLDNTWCWYCRFVLLEGVNRGIGSVVPSTCTVIEMAPWPTPAHQQIQFLGWIRGLRQSPACPQTCSEERSLRRSTPLTNRTHKTNQVISKHLRTHKRPNQLWHMRGRWPCCSGVPCPLCFVFGGWLGPDGPLHGANRRDQFVPILLLLLSLFDKR